MYVCSHLGAVAQAGLGELLGVQQLCLKTCPEITGVCLFEHGIKGLTQNQVCVLYTQHVL